MKIPSRANAHRHNNNNNNNNKKGLRISNFVLLLVVFKRHHGSERDKQNVKKKKKLKKKNRFILTTVVNINSYLFVVQHMETDCTSKRLIHCKLQTCHWLRHDTQNEGNPNKRQPKQYGQCMQTPSTSLPHPSFNHCCI